MSAQLKRYRVTKSYYVYYESDQEAVTAMKQEILLENITSDSHPNLISLCEVPFGTADCLELKII